MEWSFELSLLFFLILSAASHITMIKSRWILSLPFVFGVLFILAYEFAFIPRDFISRTKLLDIGVIAYNVLIIHAGTMFSFKALWKMKKALLIILIGYGLITLTFLLLGAPLFGNPMSLIAIAAIPGGGATCAIASFTLLKNHPQLSFFPWLLFMFQGFFSIPLFSILVKKEKSLLKSPEPTKTMEVNIPISKGSRYKGTAYYLGILMLFSFLNKFLFSGFMESTGIALTLTALFFGIIIGELGLVDRGPLQKADCFGLLMLGLMSLMAETLAHVSLSSIIGMLVPVLVLFTIATSALILTGLLLSRPLGYSPTRAMAIALGAITATPANAVIIKGIFGASEGKDSAQLIDETNIGSMYGINIFSVAIISILAAFI